MNKVPMTVEGAEALKIELNRRKTIDRPRIIEAIATARAHGDLKENAEYHAAREEQSFNEGRILELEAKVSNAQVIDVTKLPNQGKVIFGATVKLCNIDTDEEVVYRIVGEDEANIKEGKISYSSPIGKALIGKEIDDSVEVKTPGGTICYDVIEVKY
jgi:transcription elongation factor GreA